MLKPVRGGISGCCVFGLKFHSERPIFLWGVFYCAGKKINVSGESQVSPKSLKCSILRIFRISAQPAAVEALCIFSRHHNMCSRSIEFGIAVLYTCTMELRQYATRIIPESVGTVLRLRATALRCRASVLSFGNFSPF